MDTVIRVGVSSIIIPLACRTVKTAACELRVGFPVFASSVTNVCRLTPASAASFCWLHPSSDRAAAISFPFIYQLVIISCLGQTVAQSVRHIRHSVNFDVDVIAIFWIEYFCCAQSDMAPCSDHEETAPALDTRVIGRPERAV